jgi:hypothetical protein
VLSSVFKEKPMATIASGESLTWVHIGDLHVTDESQPNYRDFLSIIDDVSTHLARDVDFCVLPGDNADDGSAEQYGLIRRGLAGRLESRRRQLAFQAAAQSVALGDDYLAGRLATDVKRNERIVADAFTVTARTFGAVATSVCRCRIDDEPWVDMHRSALQPQWELKCEAPSTQFTVTVEATDASGSTDTDTIVIAAAGFRPPHRTADGSDADAVGAWPERHLLGTRLGPNRNGRQW